MDNVSLYLRYLWASEVVYKGFKARKLRQDTLSEASLIGYVIMIGSNDRLTGVARLTPTFL